MDRQLYVVAKLMSIHHGVIKPSNHVSMITGLNDAAQNFVTWRF